MENYRLKIKIGDFEFDAEGPHDVVQAQFQAFQEMVTSLPRPVSPKPPVEERRNEPATEHGKAADPAMIDAALSKIMQVDNRIISLTVKPKSADDGVLLLLYGQRVLRDNDSVTGGEIVDGLTATGGLDIGRSDRLLERAARNGDVIVIGERRGKRYRLTNAGLTKARILANDLIAIVAVL